MNAFIVMPFSQQFEAVYSAILKACEITAIQAVRADEITRPGPIINQIFTAIDNATLIIAEVSDKNPNVYYELAIAHTQGIPTILLAHHDTIDDLPFDIRHNRVLIYDSTDLNTLINTLVDHLTYVKTTILGKEKSASIEEYLMNLSSNREDGNILLNKIVDQVANDFNLINPKLKEKKFLKGEGFLITFEDDFAEKVVLLIDVNGIIRKAKRL